jgi:hypothetical protein
LSGEEKMDRRLVIALLSVALVFCFANFVGGAPSLIGSTGLFRVISADNGGFGRTAAGYHIEYGQMDSLNRGYNGWMALSYTAYDFLEASLGLPHRYWMTRVGNKWMEGPPDGTGDMTFGVKGSYPLAENAKGGLFAFYNIPTLGALGDANLKPPEWWKHYGALGAKAIVSYTYKPFQGHVNLGLSGSLDKKVEVPGEKAKGIYPYLTIPFGIAVQCSIQNYTPFLEIYAEYTIDSTKYHNITDPTATKTRSIMQNPIWITPGVRYTTPFGLTIDGALDLNVAQSDHDYGITKSNPSWMASLGVTYMWETAAGVNPSSCVTGLVKDKDTRKPLEATVMVGDDLFKTDPLTGEYGCKRRGPGTFVIQVSSKGYISQKRTVTLTLDMVQKRIPLLVNFDLEKTAAPVVAAPAILQGTVTDFDTRKPLPASITFKEPGLPALTCDPATGRYSTEIPAGSYTMIIACEGYLTESVPVTVESGKTTTLDWTLHSKLRKFVLRGINFETASAKILPESTPVLENAVAVLKENPTVIVEIGGHTDWRGTSQYNLGLSQARANSVRDYLIAAGIAPNRMTARGYGEDSPIATNSTPEGMAANRRIEFTILSQ